MPVDSNGSMSLLSQFKTSLLLNKLGCQEGWVFYRAYLCCLPKPQWHILEGTAKIDTVEKFCEHLAEFPSFLFFPFLSSSFSGVPSLNINHNPYSRGSVNTRNCQVLTPFIMSLVPQPPPLGIACERDSLLPEVSENWVQYKPGEKSKQG